MNIGLLGGGQLGRMMIQAAHQLGHTVTVLDPDPNGPAGQIADQVIVGAYDDPQALTQLAQSASVFTTEFENVPAASLRFLAAHGPTYPNADCVEKAQDRLVEKAFIQSAGVAVAAHAAIRSVDDLKTCAAELFPAILKTARLGYDGKGQAVVQNRDQAIEAFKSMGAVVCVLEKKLPLAKEISVIIARHADGSVAVFPVGENIHKGGILDTTMVPAQIDDQLASTARDAASRIAQTMGYVGVLCVEFFVLADGSLVANEMAPRPHNSGHYSIEACQTSQFEQQVRICTGQALGSTDLKFPVRMTNLLGDLWFPNGEAAGQVEPDWAAMTQTPGSSLHLYGKAQARPGRKMGHLTQRLDV
jgi:5-(carboxyamino)imidazole ribonucleotide synthase